MRTVVALGDSVPAGTGCACDPFPDLYARSQHSLDVNLAEPGYTAPDVLAQLPADRSVLASAAEVLLMVGANDLAEAFTDGDPYPPAAANVQRAVVAVIESLRPVPVIVLGYWNVVQDGQVGAAHYGPDGVRSAAAATISANDALRAAAAQTGATYVPTIAAFHGPDGTGDPTNLLAPDGDHPNAAGQAAIAALIPPISSISSGDVSKRAPPVRATG